MAKNKLNILVVEDDEIDFLAVKRHLNWSSNTEFKLTRAVGYPQAVEAVEQHNFDCALIDYNLNGQSGYDLMTALGGREAPFPVIILTGHKIGAINALEPVEGAFDFLEKTALTQQLLQRTIFYALENYQAETVLRKALEEAEHSAAMGRSILQLVSREVAEPLEAIKHGTDNNEILQGRVREALQVLSLLADYMLLEDGKLVLASEECDADSVFARAISEADKLPPGVEMSVDLDGLAGGKLIADSDRLQQLLTCMMSFFSAQTNTAKLSVKADVSDEGLRVEADLRFRQAVPEELADASCFDQEGMLSAEEMTSQALSCAIAKKLVAVMNGSCDMVVENDDTLHFCVLVPSAAPAVCVPVGQIVRTA